jgi:catechol 2,3-dioxygenase-like lactoylglutathione lyase family enzyme
MITKLSHASIYVNDQDKAYDFYVNKLGFKVNTDVTMDNGFRWLTVNPPDQPIWKLSCSQLMEQMVLMKKPIRL